MSRAYIALTLAASAVLGMFVGTFVLATTDLPTRTGIAVGLVMAAAVLAVSVLAYGDPDAPEGDR